MANQQLLKDMFQRYLKNKCSIHEIKFLLKHFISEDNEAALRQLITEKLKDYQFDENVKIKNSVFFDDTFNSILKRTEALQNAIPNPKTNQGNPSVIIKTTAIVVLALLLMQSVYMYYSSVQIRVVELAKVNIHKSNHRAW